MGRALITATVVVILAFLVFAGVVWWKRHNARREDIKAGRPVRGDLNRAQENELRALLVDAAEVMRSLGAGNPLEGRVDFLTEESDAAVKQWLRRYHGRSINA